MKYIRTKDCIYKVCNSKWVEDISGYTIYDLENDSVDIVKKADTIEELCDEFVYKFKTGKEKPHITISAYNYDDINIVREHIKKMYDEQTKIYGAIWTDKGLIYVAKLNDKGELELL